MQKPMAHDFILVQIYRSVKKLVNTGDAWGQQVEAHWTISALLETISSIYIPPEDVLKVVARLKDIGRECKLKEPRIKILDIADQIQEDFDLEQEELAG